MVLGFVIILGGLLALVAGWTGRGIGEVIRGEAAKGFPFSGLTQARIDIQPGASTGGGDSTGGGTAFSSNISTTGGARELVDQIAQLYKSFGVPVISDSRPGATTTSGNTSDHSENNSNRAARDLSNTGNKGPSSQMDAAVEAAGAMFGKHYNGKNTIIDTIHHNGLRIQVIHRTPLYGGHMGHDHWGARKD